MPRVKNGVAHHARKKKIMEAAKGARGGRSKLYKAAKETAERAMRYAYRDRRKKKGEFRALWITRINAAARSQGMSYSRLMAGLRKAGVDINRKVLADLAVHDLAAFAKIAEMAKSADRNRSGPARCGRPRRPHPGVRPMGPFAVGGRPHHRIQPSVTLPRYMADPTGYPDLDALLPRLEAVPASTVEALAAELIAVLGRKNGALTEALKSVPTLPLDQRKGYGAAVNQLKARFEAAFAARREALDAERRQRESAGVDLTMPARRRWVGAEHPVTRVVDEIVEIFRGLGFTVAVGPEVETEWYNFTALNFPADHPAMDMHDTLYVDAPPIAGEQGGRLLLRTHTSPVQIRAMLRVTAAGAGDHSGTGLPQRSLRRVARAGLLPDRRPGGRRGNLLRGSQGHAGPLCAPVLLAHHQGALPALVLSLHRAFGRDGRRVPALPRQRLSGLQGDRLDGDPRLRHGASGGVRALRRRSRALHRLGLRHGAAPDHDAALRHSRTSGCSMTGTCGSWSSSSRRSGAGTRPRVDGQRGRSHERLPRWLEDFLRRRLDVTDVTERLAMLGAPVDAVEPLHAGLDDMLIGLVEEVRPHPNADRLRRLLW